MSIKDKIEKKIRKRIAKKTIKNKLSSILSDERARELASDIIGGVEYDRDKENKDKSGSESVSWLERKANKAEKKLEEDDGAVTGLNDMEKRIQEMKEKSE